MSDLAFPRSARGGPTPLAVSDWRSARRIVTPHGRAAHENGRFGCVDSKRCATLMAPLTPAPIGRGLAHADVIALRRSRRLPYSIGLSAALARWTAAFVRLCPVLRAAHEPKNRRHARQEHQCSQRIKQRFDRRDTKMETRHRSRRFARR